MTNYGDRNTKEPAILPVPFNCLDKKADGTGGVLTEFGQTIVMAGPLRRHRIAEDGYCRGDPIIRSRLEHEYAWITLITY